MSDEEMRPSLTHHEEYDDEGNLIRGWDEIDYVVVDGARYSPKQLGEFFADTRLGQLSPTQMMQAIILKIEGISERLESLEDKTERKIG